MKVLVAGFVVLLAGAAVAQSDDPFWSAPDKIVRDAAGKVTYQEIRDRSNYSRKVYARGVWVTEHYRPHTAKLIQIDAPDTTEEWLYDEKGSTNGLRVHIDSVSLAIHSEQDHRLSATGFGLLTLERDRDGRVTAIRDEKGSDLARFDFDKTGYVRSVVTPAQKLEMTPPARDGVVTETLRAADGRAVTSVSVPGATTNPHSLSFCLDAVAAQLGLGAGWQSEVTFKTSVTTSVLTGRRSNGIPLVYIIAYGGNRFVFEASGKPLLIDFAIPLVAMSLGPQGIDTALAIHAQSAVAPNHIVVTADGRVGACTDGSASGAISSFWTERRGDGSLVSRYKVIGAAQKSGSRAQQQNVAPQAQKASGVSTKRIAPNNFYVCDTATVCTTDEFTGTTCTTTDYLCDDLSGGGGGGGSGGGGSASSPSPSNKITDDSILKQQVQNAIDTAAAKLTICGNALAALTAVGGNTTLAANLAGKIGGPWTMDSYIQGKSNGTGEVFHVDTGSSYCAAGAVAYTVLLGNDTYICRQAFLQLTAMEQWQRLIHEELHCLGLPENPPDPSARTPEEITKLVSNNCN